MSGEEDVPWGSDAHRREEGCRREEAIRSLLKRHGDRRLTIGAVEVVAWELGVSRSTMYRLVTAYRAKGRCRRWSRKVGSAERHSRVGR